MPTINAKDLLVLIRKANEGDTEAKTILNKLSGNKE